MMSHDDATHTSMEISPDPTAVAALVTLAAAVDEEMKSADEQPNFSLRDPHFPGQIAW
jgi:hypothetical protein